MRIHLLLSLLLVSCATARPDETPREWRVMSFNLRYGTANDGQDSWPNRRELVAETIRRFRPDVLGVQEALRFQLDGLAADLGQYEEVGVGRTDGVTDGEYSAILFDPVRFELLEQGTFWLSDDPETPGSTSWGNSITRICTWARLEERGTGAVALVLNTHWDHQSQPSRERSAGLIMERVAELGARVPVLLMGDFNAGEQNPAFRRLVEDEHRTLRDTFRVLHPAATEVGTFNGFEGRRDGQKIDAVLCSDEWEVVGAEIDDTNRDGRWPSDHFPVWTVLRLP